MVERPNKPKLVPLSPTTATPQPIVSFSDDNSRVTAELPSGESVTVLLYGATVISWKDAEGQEKLWLSEAAKLDGSKAVRGGIPLVFPVFGPPSPDHAQTAKLVQHGFARTSRWEFLGKSTSESAAGAASVKLDFGLSSAAEGLDPAAREAWPFKFSLIYSVTLCPGSLTTAIVATNDDDKPFDCHALFHTYLRVDDISSVSISGLDGAAYIDKLSPSDPNKTESSSSVTITGETDRVYTPTSNEITVLQGDKPIFRITRDNLTNVVVWNPWTEKAASMGDFAPKDGYKNMLCVEPGSVGTWQVVEPGDAFEGAQTISLVGA